MRLLLLICSLAVLSGRSAPVGQESLTPAEMRQDHKGSDIQRSSPSVSVRIETGMLNPTSGVDTIDLVYESDSAIGGFDLKLMVDNQQVEIVEILPGRLIDSCRWEFFNARELTVLLDDRQPDQSAWQVTALPEVIQDSVKPACYGSKEPISLCRIVISKAVPSPQIGSLSHNPKETHILFVWEDCSDNTMASKSGKNLWVSSNVADVDSAVISKTFPNTSGFTESCVTARNSGRVKRLVDYRAGVILF